MRPDTKILISTDWVTFTESLYHRDPFKWLELCAFVFGVAFGEFENAKYFEDPELAEIMRHTKIIPAQGRRAGRVDYLKRGGRNGK